MKGYDERRVDTQFYLRISSGFFPVSAPLLDVLLERIMLGYFGAPSEEGHCVTTPALSACDVS